MTEAVDAEIDDLATWLGLDVMRVVTRREVSPVGR